ncbi:glycosyltransferase [Candidatus Parcubacteria bacterium]|nr:MAG: glycosyltransferase [Candidatus Parcubacteria bacterium]
MRILFFTPYFYPHIGGVEKHVEKISRKLLEKGHKVFLITQKTLDQEINQNSSCQTDAQSDNEAKKIKKIDLTIQTEHKFNNKLEILYLDFGKEGKLKKFRIWLLLWKNRNFIKQADVIHCHDVFIWYLPFRFLFFNKPIFTTFHGYEEYPLRKKTILIRKLSEILSYGNICIGDFIKKWYKTKPDYVSYGAAKKNIKYQISNIKYKNSAVFFGRLDEQTGIQTYLRAYKLIKKKIPDFNFLVIGDGKYRTQIGKDVEVIGFKKNPEKYLQHYRFAFVSRYLSILEAMAAKRLVFAVYDNPIKRDYLKMSPFAKGIIITDSSKELSERVIYFINNPQEERDMVEEAYKWVKDQTWENMVNTYLRLWKNRSK